jgi:beta-N-acetylhexosaminidase
MVEARGGRMREQINKSVYNLLYQKALLELHKNRFVDEAEIGKTVGTAEHKKLITEVADRSITLLKNDGLLPIIDLNERSIVHIAIQKIENQPAVDELVTKLSSTFSAIQNFKLTPETDEPFYGQALLAAKQADLVVLSFFVQRDRHGDNAPIREKDLLLIQKIIQDKPHAVIAMSYGNPYLIDKIKNVPVFLTGYGEGGWYGNQVIYFDSFIKVLKSELSPKGKLPISINNELQIGFGLTF